MDRDYFTIGDYRAYIQIINYSYNWIQWAIQGQKQYIPNQVFYGRLGHHNKEELE